MGLRRRIRAAKARAVLAREARIEAAWGRLPELADLQKRPDQKPEEARASTTDAEATVMKRRRADSSRRTTSNLAVTRPVRGWSASRSSPRAVTWGRGHRWGSRGEPLRTGTRRLAGGLRISGARPDGFGGHPNARDCSCAPAESQEDKDRRSGGRPGGGRGFGEPGRNCRSAPEEARRQDSRGRSVRVCSR